MSASVLQDLIERARALSLDEQLRLAAHLVEQARLATSRPRARWGDLCGIAPDLLDREDAQAWVTRTRRESEVTRTRRESDEHRATPMQRLAQLQAARTLPNNLSEPKDGRVCRQDQ